MPSTIALIAHDTRKDDIVRFALAYTPTLARYKLIATAITAKRIQSATGLPVEQKLTDSVGGDVQIAAEVASGNVLAVIFLVDPQGWVSRNPLRLKLKLTEMFTNLKRVPSRLRMLLCLPIF